MSEKNWYLDKRNKSLITKDEKKKKMNSGITILVFALFFFWLFSEVKAISYKRKIDAND